MKIIHSLRNETLDRLYVLNPDPWPKKRHHKRRIISLENLDAFSRVLKLGAQLIMATDVDDLADWMIEKTAPHAHFAWINKDDILATPEDWALTTRYAEKGQKAGRETKYLIFIKKTGI